MKKTGFLFALLSAVMGTSCNDPYADDTYVVYDMQPASTYLSTRSDEFSEWIEVMKYADLYNAVNQATQYYTLFVPTNKAMEEFYQKKGVASIQELGEEYAIELVKHHLIQDTIGEAEFIATEGQLEKKTVADDYLSVNIKEGEGELGGINSIYINNEAHVIEFANLVSNGYVYVLENTMTPLTESLYERFAENTGEYGIFKEALDKTGWGEEIDSIYKEVTDDQGIVTEEKNDYTVLAVTDATYRQNGINSFDDLVQKLESGSDYTDAANALHDYVGYHILPGASDLTRMQKFDTNDATSKLWDTMSDAGVLRVSDRDGLFWLNYNDENSRCQFVEDASDVQAKNGYVHQVSGWMPVAEPDPETVLFDLTNYPQMKQYCEEYGEKEQKYQPAPEVLDDTERNCELDGHNPTCYEYKLNKPAKFGYRINYFTVKKSGGWEIANYGDFLMLNLGFNGWISMQTPSIIKGRYKVTFYMGYAKSMKFIADGTDGSDGGQIAVTFDDQNEKRVKPYTQVASGDRGKSVYFPVTVYDELEFGKTDTHQLKIMFCDPAASGNSDKYRMMFDYVLFEPITEEAD